MSAIELLEESRRLSAIVHARSDALVSGNKNILPEFEFMLQLGAMADELRQSIQLAQLQSDIDQLAKVYE